MSALDQFIAFHAAIRLLRLSGRDRILHQVYQNCLSQRTLPDSERTNCVKDIYAPFTEAEISQSIVALLVEESTHPLKAKIDILYQSLDGLHRAIPDYPGDWYFSGDYPTPGGNRMVNEAYISFYEKNIQQ